jgi:hypothetical protein
MYRIICELKSHNTIYFVVFIQSDEMFRLLIRPPSGHKIYTGCPTRYRTRHFFNQFTTNEDIATKFKAGLPYCVRNVKGKNVLLFKFRCNIFIGVRIIEEMLGSVASGTPCMY